MSKKRNGFAFGVLVLLLSNILVKILGMIFKIPLQRLIGDEGMGYFNVAYNIYSCLYLLSSAGLPSAVCVTVSNFNASGRSHLTERYFKLTLFAFLFFGSALSTLALLFSKQLSIAVGTPLAHYCIAFISPSIAALCIVSAIRGYFQGYGIMRVTAISQLLEAFGRTAFGVMLSLSALNAGYSVHICAAFAILGVTLGSYLSLIYCIVAKTFIKPTKEPCDFEIRVRNTDLIRQTLKLALPITLSSLIMSAANLIDTSMATRHLTLLGYSQKQAASIFGNYSTLAISMFNLPSVLIYPICYAAVPVISSSYAQRHCQKLKSSIKSIYKLISFIAIPCSLGLCVLSKPILSLIFSPDSAQTAYKMLSYLAPAVFFYAIVAVTDSVFQATGNEKIPIVTMLIGAVAKLVSCPILMTNKDIERYGIPISTCICYFITMLLNIVLAAKRLNVLPDLKNTILKPLLCSAICVFAAYITNSFTECILAAIAVGVIIYVLSLVLFKCINQEDLAFIPHGNKISRIIKTEKT